MVKNIPKYNLTKGINEKYRSISDQVISNIPEIKDWFNNDFLKKNKLIGGMNGLKTR